MKDIAINSNNQVIKFILYSLTLINLGCSTTYNSGATIESCLKSYKKNNLEHTLKICEKIIARFPNNPQPLNDRSLIYTLNNKPALACKDVNQAMLLLKNSSSSIDPLIKYQIEIRHKNCKK